MGQLLRTSFARELETLQTDTLMLGSMVIQALKESVEALRQRDMETARRLIKEDEVINRKRFEIEADCLRLIATQQPMAGNLRLIAAVLEISTELERIGDYAKGIGRIILLIGPEALLKPLVDIPRMCEIATNMLQQALDAFLNQDVEAARTIPLQDDEVDALYNQVHRDLIALILEDPSLIDRTNYLLWAAHNLERAADRVTNICERIIFTVTGEFIEFDMN